MLWISFYVVIIILNIFNMTEISLQGYPVSPQNPNGAGINVVGETHQ